MIHECPLCALEFEYEVCHTTCPMARGCKMVRCPRCSYEFVEEGLLVSLLRKVVPKGFFRDSSAH
ncbi:MAG TPA: hypothetical protein VHU41_06735 [Thermoanaerobaculia bacterium]|nr:hypothetical protein [Thermoanaerobaculia bacterium]